jgi:hypothetical protein
VQVVWPVLVSDSVAGSFVLDGSGSASVPWMIVTLRSVPLQAVPEVLCPDDEPALDGAALDAAPLDAEPEPDAGAEADVTVDVTVTGAAAAEVWATEVWAAAPALVDLVLLEQAPASKTAAKTAAAAADR